MTPKIQCNIRGCKKECGWGVTYKGQTLYSCEDHETPKHMNLNGSCFVLDGDGMDLYELAFPSQF